MPGLYQLAGAGPAEYARQWILLNRTEEYQVGSGIHNLWLSVGSSCRQTADSAHRMTIDEGQDKQKWGVMLESTLEHVRKSEKHQSDSLVSNLLSAMDSIAGNTANKQPITQAAIRKFLAGWNLQKVKEAIQAALLSGDLEQYVGTVNKATVQCYKRK